MTVYACFLSFLVSFLGFALVLVVDLFTDFYQIEVLCQSPNHKRGAILRGIFLLVVVLPLYFMGWTFCLVYLSTLCLLFFLLFDLFLNRLRQRDWFYIGQSEDKEEDALTDRALERIFGKRPHVAFYAKILLFCISVFVLCLLWPH